MTDIKTEIILCECYDLNHQMIVTHDTDDNLVYLNVKSNIEEKENNINIKTTFPSD